MKTGIFTAESARQRQLDYFIVLLFLMLAIITIKLRGLMPFDETRYMAVAWEMWKENDFLIPRINGEIYHDKPPLLFWLINFGWFLTGTNEWLPRSIPFVFSIFNIFLTRYIAMQLWPEIHLLKLTVPLVLVAMPVWLFYSTLLMFDVLQIFFILIANIGLLNFHNKYRGPSLFGVAVGLGFLLKGPVIFLYVMPLAISLPLWDKKYIYGTGVLVMQICLSILISSIVVSMWIIPVIHVIGFDKTLTFFWNETAARIMHASSHSRPMWWYFYFLPLILFPWFYRSDLPEFLKISPVSNRPQILFCLIWIFAPIVFFLFIDAKQLHYLLPLLPAVSILIAYKLAINDPSSVNRINYPVSIVFIISGTTFLFYTVLANSPDKKSWIVNIPVWWSYIAIIAGFVLIYTRNIRLQFPALLPGVMSVVVFISLYICVLIAPRPFTNINNLSRILASMQVQNIPLGSVGAHREQFAFPGRLKHPIKKVQPGRVVSWARDHPDGYLVAMIKESEYNLEIIKSTYSQPYRLKHRLILIGSKEVLNSNLYNMDNQRSSE